MPAPQEGGTSPTSLPSQSRDRFPSQVFSDAKKKQAARTLALQAAYRKAEANIKRDDAPSAGEIRRLGVLDAPLEEKNLKPSKWFPHKEIN